VGSLSGRQILGSLGVMVFSLVMMVGMLVPVSPSGATTVQGISGDTITVGGVYDSVDWAGTEAGFMARIDRANKDHELGKYKIKLVALDDDNENPQTDLADVQSLIERDHVFALAPVITEGFEQPPATFAAEHDVPYFGAGFSPGFCSPNTWGYSNNGCDIGGDYYQEQAISSVAKALGKPVKALRWALVGLDAPTGPASDASYAEVIKADGGKIVYDQAVVPETVGNLAPIVNSVEATKPDVVMAQLALQAIAFEGALESSGFAGAALNEALYSPGLLKIKALATPLNNTYVITTTPVLEENTPYVKQMEKDYAAEGLPTSAITFGGEYGYTTADVMIAMLKKVAPNFGNLHSAMEKGFTFTPAYGGAPLKYPFMFNAPADCASVVKIENGVYVPVAKFQCSDKYLKAKSSS